jgi:hypothetical protein
MGVDVGGDGGAGLGSAATTDRPTAPVEAHARAGKDARLLERPMQTAIFAVEKRPRLGLTCASLFRRAWGPRLRSGLDPSWKPPNLMRFAPP